MESSLKDKITVITGSTRGFGYAIAEEMLKAGAIVVITGRTEETTPAGNQIIKLAWKGIGVAVRCPG